MVCLTVILFMYMQNKCKYTEFDETNNRWKDGYKFSYKYGGMNWILDDITVDDIKSNGIRDKNIDRRQKKAIIFVGIIDILQQYTTQKKMETFLKSMKHNKLQISSIDPNKYADRMIEFFDMYVK